GDAEETAARAAQASWLSIEQRCDAAYAKGHAGAHPHAKGHARALSDATAVAAKHQERLEKELKERIELIERLQMQLQKVEKERHVLTQRTSELESQVLQLTKRISVEESVKHERISVPQNEDQLVAENNELKAILNDNNKKMRELEEELLLVKSQCLDQVIDSQVSTSELRLDVEQTRKRIGNEAGVQRAENLRAHQDMVNRMIQMGEKSKESDQNLKKLQGEDQKLAAEMVSKIEKLGDQEQQDLIHGTLKALELENQVLNMRNAQLEREALREYTSKVDERRPHPDGMNVLDNADEAVKTENVSSNLPHVTDSTALSQHYENQIIQLQELAEGLKEQITQYEKKCSDLKRENLELEGIVTNIFEDIQEIQKLSDALPDQNVSVLTNSPERHNSRFILMMEKVKAIRAALSSFTNTLKSYQEEKKCLELELEGSARVIQDLETQVAKAEEERNALEVSMEELDQQHQDAIDKLIGLRNAELMENTQLKSEILELKTVVSQKTQLRDCSIQTEEWSVDNVIREASTQTDHVHQCDQENQTSLHCDKETSENMTEEKILNVEADSFKYDYELSEKIKKLVNFDLPNDFNNTIPQSLYLVEEIVKIVNDCKWKKDTLERKISELIRENKEDKSTITILEAECSNLKENVERLAEQLVGVAKSCKDPLPTIIENCEEAEQLEQKVAILEEEVAVLRETRVNLEEDAARMREEREELLGRIRNTEAQLRNKENIVTELQRFANEANTSAHSNLAASELAEKARISAEDKAKTLSQELETCVQNYGKQLQDLEELANTLEIKNKGLIEDIKIKEMKLEEYKNYISELELEKNAFSVQLQNNTSKLEMVEKKFYNEKETLHKEIMLLQEQLTVMGAEGDKFTAVSEDLEVNLKAKLDLEHQLEIATKSLKKAELLIINQEELKADVKKWQNMATSEEMKVRDTLALMVKLEEENRVLKEKLREEQLTTESLNLKNEQNMKDILELREQLEEELAKVRTGQLLEDLQTKHHSEITILKNDKNQLEQSLSLALQQHNLLKQEVESHKAVLLQKEQSEAFLHQTNLDLKIQMNALEKYKEEYLESTKKFEEEKQKFCSKITSLENNLREEVHLSEKVQYLESHVHILVQEKESLMEENSKLKAALSDSYRDKFNKMANRNSTLHGDIPLLSRHSIENDNKKTMEIKQLQQDKQTVLLRLDEKLQEIDLLKLRLKDLSSKVDENYETIRKLEQEKENITNEKSQCEDKFAMTKETVMKLSEMIKEKDQELTEMKTQLSSLSAAAQRNDGYHQQLAQARDLTAQLVQERDQLLQTVHVKHQESLQYHAEIQRLSALLSQEMGKSQQLAAQCASLAQQQGEEKASQQEAQQLQDSLRVKDEALQKLCKRLELQEQELQARGNELEALQHQMESMAQSKAAQVVQMAAKDLQDEDVQEKLKEINSKWQDEQRKNKSLQNELEICQGKELALQREVERLRVHLVEIEDMYTQEALKSEERNKDLSSKLQQAEEMMKSSSTVYKSANIRANQQVETLQEQARLIAQQRDDVQLKLSAAEDQVGKHSAALRNLQAVLEQFQRDREREIEAARQSVYVKVEVAQRRHDELLNEISSLKMQLKEANEGLGAASRLGEELERKTEIVNRLKQEVVHLEEKVLKAEGEAKMVEQTVEGKVDKSLVKNVVLGFFLAPSNSKDQVLHVVASVLDFSEDETSRVQKRLGLHGSEGSGGWFKSLLHPSGQNQSNNQSLSEAFVRFLENESIPQPKLKMLPEAEKQAGSSSNSPRATPVSTQRKSPLLLADVQLPTFAQFPVGRNSSSILKDILKES
ncbi:Thyroid receptor-interacting protein 11, partial [Gryllus bimaculatus]